MRTLQESASRLDTSPPSQPPGSRRRSVALFTVLVVLIAAAIGGFIWLRDGGDSSDAWTTWSSGVTECACQMDIAADGTVWVAGWDGISRFDGTEWTQIQPPQAISGEGWPAMAVADDGSVWISGMSFVGRYLDGQWHDVVAASDVYDVVGVGGEQGPAWFQGLWIGSDGLPYTDLADVVGVIQDGTFKPQNEPPPPDTGGFVPPTDSVSILTVAADDTVWMGMGDTVAGIEGALIEYDGTNFTRHALGGVAAVEVEADGTAWFLVPRAGPDPRLDTQWSSPGLYRLQGDTWYHITRTDGLVDDRISNMRLDADGAIWLSYADGRVTRYEPAPTPTSGTEVDIAASPFSEADWPPSLYPPLTTAP